MVVLEKGDVLGVYGTVKRFLIWMIIDLKSATSFSRILLASVCSRVTIVIDAGASNTDEIGNPFPRGRMSEMKHFKGLKVLDGR